MKIFFISDIHGNQFALEAILETAVAAKSDRIYCLGDISGYFTGINEVIQQLKTNHVVSLKGNHDGFLTGSLIIDNHKAYYSAFVKTKNSIGDEEYKWISQLADYSKIKVDNYLFEMFHGGPNDHLNEYVFPNRIDYNNYRQKPSNLFLFGHSHLQFVLHINDKIFANPGSVGLPRNGDYRAHGLLFDTKENRFEEYKVPYDLNRFNDTYYQDSSVNRVYLHNINFGRSSSKILINSHNPFLCKKTTLLLESHKFSIINTKFGAILSYKEKLVFDNLIYIASYADGTVELTSNTLIFNWQIEKNNKLSFNNLKSEEFKKDMAGFYYFKIFLSAKVFKMNIMNIIKNAFENITLFKNGKI